MVRLLTIVGPTASGKTALAIKLAESYNGEIIAADSRTVYKYLDIGTAKPAAGERGGIAHWGFDLAGPGDKYTVADFQKYAADKISEIIDRQRLPVLVGGSGLYVDAVVYGFSLAPADEYLRRVLEKMSTHQLQRKITANHLDMPFNRFNRRHLIRTIERQGASLTRKPLSSDNLIIGLNPTKVELERRIEARAKQMIDRGVVREIEEAAAIYGWQAAALDGGIYRVFKEKLAGQRTPEQIMAAFIRSDLKLAKKQMTWFKRNPDIKWFAGGEEAFAWFGQAYGGKL